MTARRVNGQTYSEWRDHFYTTQSLTLPMDLEAKRQMLFNSCPNGFFPSVDGLRWKAFVDMDRGADKRSGQVYLMDTQTSRVNVQDFTQLAFVDFQDVCLRRAQLANSDIENIRDMAHEWAAVNPGQQLDVDRFVADIKRAAGL